MKKGLFLLFSIITFCCYSQETKRVLFIGNSYTYYNDMPDMVVQAAASAGDILIQDDNAVADASFSTHATKGATIAKIMQGNWDYVALQEAGRSPGRDEQFFMQNVYPYASDLNDLIEEYNPCGETLFYMNWGERNGVPGECASWPPFCSYETMDDLLRERILILTEDFEAETSPVGAVWRYIRENHPNIDLYAPDGWHPSLAGSYAAAISFYTSIFRKDPNLVTYNSTLSSSEANAIRAAVETVVYNDFPRWFIGSHDPVADFTYQKIASLEYEFTNNSMFSVDYLWNFGDGNFSTDENPTHLYDQEGAYEVTLTSNFACGNASANSQTISATLGVQDFQSEESIYMYPNPLKNRTTIHFPTTISGQLTIEVLSINGMKIYSSEVIIDENEVTIDLSVLNTGYYFLLVRNDGFTKRIMKFIKE